MKQQLIDHFNTSVNQGNISLTKDTLDKALLILDALEPFNLNEIEYDTYYDNLISIGIWHNDKYLDLTTDGKYKLWFYYDVLDGLWNVPLTGTFNYYDIPELIGKLNEVN